MNFQWEMWFHPAAGDWFARFGMVYPAVWGFVLFWVFAFGACIGSFLNVCIWRIPRGESLSKAASHCTVCGTPIRWYDNLPVLSYLLLRGRCRACHARYSSTYFWVELSCGGLFALALLKTGLSRQVPELIPAQWALIFFAIGAALIDLRHRIIPDRMNYAAMVTGLLLALIFPAAWGTVSRFGAAATCVLSGVIPAAFAAIFACVGKWLCKKSVLGWGDVKFLVGIGMLAGLPGGVFSLFFGAASGCIVGLICGRKYDDPIPLGPFLAAGALIWIFADQRLLEMYKTICVSI